MAPKSSTMAKAVKKTFKLKGTLFPNKEITVNEKAISVAVGIAQHELQTLLRQRAADVDADHVGAQEQQR